MVRDKKWMLSVVIFFILILFVNGVLSASGDKPKRKKPVIVKVKPAPHAKPVIVHRHTVYRPLVGLPHGHRPFTWRDRPYYYDNGQYYWHTQAGYVRIAGPRGYSLTVLSPGYRTLRWTGVNYFYHLGTFYRYEEAQKVYVVVTPPEGIEITDFPQEFETLKHAGVTFYYSLGTFYRHDPARRTYKVTTPPKGIVVQTIPFDYEIQERDGQEIIVYNGISYEVLGEGENMAYRVL